MVCPELFKKEVCKEMCSTCVLLLLGLYNTYIHIYILHCSKGKIEYPWESTRDTYNIYHIYGLYFMVFMGGGHMVFQCVSCFGVTTAVLVSSKTPKPWRVDCQR